jgi:hypothetical protein
MRSTFIRRWARQSMFEPRDAVFDTAMEDDLDFNLPNIGPFGGARKVHPRGPTTHVDSGLDIAVAF